MSGLGLLPSRIFKILMADSAKSINTIISNTPGPKMPIYFWNQKVHDISAIGPNVGNSGITFHISSYWGNVKIQFLVDYDIQMDPLKLLAHLENQLDKLIEN